MFWRTESSSTVWNWPSWVQLGQLSSRWGGQCYGRPTLLQDFAEQVWCILMGYSCRDFGLNEVAICFTTDCANWTTPQNTSQFTWKFPGEWTVFASCNFFFRGHSSAYISHLLRFSRKELVTPTLFTRGFKEQQLLLIMAIILNWEFLKADGHFWRQYTKKTCPLIWSNLSEITLPFCHE